MSKKFISTLNFYSNFFVEGKKRHLVLVMLNCRLPQRQPVSSHSVQGDTSQSMGQSIGHLDSSSAGRSDKSQNDSRTGRPLLIRTHLAPRNRRPSPQAESPTGRQLDLKVQNDSSLQTVLTFIKI
jgi:hypothetical protein